MFRLEYCSMMKCILKTLNIRLECNVMSLYVMLLKIKTFCKKKTNYKSVNYVRINSYQRRAAMEVTVHLRLLFMHMRTFQYSRQFYLCILIHILQKDTIFVVI